MLPVCIGNFIAGAICVAASYSFAFGAFGQSFCGIKDNCSCFTTGCACLPTSQGGAPELPTTMTTPSEYAPDKEGPKSITILWKPPPTDRDSYQLPRPVRVPAPVG